MALFTTQTEFFRQMLEADYLRNSKWSHLTADLHILKTPEMSVQTIRIKTLTSVSSSGRFHIFSLYSCDVE